MLDSFYHMALKLFKNHIFDVKTSIFCHLLHVSNVKMDVVTYYCIKNVLHAINSHVLTDKKNMY